MLWEKSNADLHFFQLFSQLLWGTDSMSKSAGNNVEVTGFEVTGAEVTRRDFFKIGGATVAAASVAAAGAVPIAAEAANESGRTTLNYPTKFVGKVSSMQVHKLVAFSYPDQASPCATVKLGKTVPGGVGPQSDIVAYSILCTHMGCPVAYNGDGTFQCGCHFSQFDAEKQGQMICGQATENLPRIELSYDVKTDSISAVGVSGLIYGRQANIL
jgi:arsenite oxidase small subunit